MKHLAIMIPAYNAEKTIEWVFDRIPEEIRGMNPRYIVVNDGSTDQTLDVLKNLQKRFPNLEVVDHGVNKGYGATEKTLLQRAMSRGAEIMALVHADGQYAPEALPFLLRPLIEGKADIVQGSRMMNGGALRGGMPVYKFIANRVLSTMENIVFGLHLAEYHSGYMLYSRRAIESIPFERLTGTFCFDQEMLIMASVKKLRIAQLPIPTHYGEEVSHLRPIRYGFGVLSLIWAYVQGYYHRL